MTIKRKSRLPKRMRDNNKYRLWHTTTHGEKSNKVRRKMAKRSRKINRKR